MNNLYYGSSRHEYAPRNPEATQQLGLLLVGIPLLIVSFIVGACLAAAAANPLYTTAGITIYGVLMFCLLAWAAVTGYEDWHNDPLAMLSNTRQECRTQWVMCLVVVVALTLGYCLF